MKQRQLEEATSQRSYNGSFKRSLAFEAHLATLEGQQPQHQISYASNRAYAFIDGEKTNNEEGKAR
jgi:hypothetical protein